MFGLFKKRLSTLPASSVLTSDGPVAYRLVFMPSQGSKALGHAELTSPMLDPIMHAGGVLRVGFTKDSGTSPLTPDSFEVGSIIEYLRNQTKVRQALEIALTEHLAEWDPEGKFGRGGTVWEKVKVKELAIGPRRVRSREEFEHGLRQLAPKITDEEINRLHALSDRPETRARFIVVLDADWEDGHCRMADFRDSELIEFRVD